MMQTNQRQLLLSRRQLLRGLGVGVALPALESVRPLLASQATGASMRPPIRMAFMEFANGALPQYWWPTGEPGRNFE